MNRYGYRAQIQQRPGFDGKELFLWRPGARGTVDVMCGQDVMWRTIDEGQVFPDVAGIALPIDAWDAIAELVHPPIDLTALKDNLATERARVDQVLGKLLA